MATKMGNRIKAAREKANLTQEDVAKRLGIGRAAYSNIENGHSLVTVEHLIRLVAILQQPITYFFGLGTGDLSEDEVTLLEYYRTIPPGTPKEAALDVVRSLAQTYQSD